MSNYVNNSNTIIKCVWKVK